MIVETCPLLEEIPWIRHGFYGIDNPCVQTQGLSGIHPFNDDFSDTLFLKQVHEKTILADGDDMTQTADAAITGRPGLALAIRTADCCPILIACPATRQIAAIHAGWPGALNGITRDAVARLVENGATSSGMIGAIGPAIQAATYPVQDDVRDRFMAQNPETAPFFTPFEDRWVLDVPGIVRQQLTQNGVSAIWQSAINTFTNEDYCSYRRFMKQGQPATGRNISLIMKINH